MKSSILNAKPKYGFFSLFTWFLLLFLISPLIQENYARIFINITFSFLLLSTVFTLQKKPTLMLLIAIFAVPTILLNSYTLYEETFWPVTLSIIVELAFIGTVGLFMFRQIFLVETVEVDLIFEALCIYLLLAIFWALLYSLIELVNPGSFQGIQEIYPNGEYTASVSTRFNLFLYFSFVTQTTLGYGDVTPISHMARNLASIQAIMVPFYLTAVVAGLIGILLRQTKRQS